MTLPPELVSSGMFFVGIVLMLLILLRLFFRYRKRLKRSESQTAQSAASRRAARAAPRDEQPLMDAPPEILRWQVEMHETARVLKAELDSKMSALQALSRIAAEEAQRLEAAIERAEKLGIAACRDTLAEVERVAYAPPGENGEIPSPLGDLPPLSLPAEGDLPGDEQRRSVAYRLADEGQSPAAIADQIGAPVGEVEMILGLRDGDGSA